MHLDRRLVSLLFPRPTVEPAIVELRCPQSSPKPKIATLGSLQPNRVRIVVNDADLYSVLPALQNIEKMNFGLVWH